MHANGCSDLRGDVHTEDKNNFGIDVNDANGKDDGDTDIESVRKGSTGG